MGNPTRTHCLEWESRYSRRAPVGHRAGCGACPGQALQDRLAHRGRWLVAGLSRAGHRPQPRGRHQGPRCRRCRRPESPQDVREGSARARGALPPEHRGGLRRRRGRRAALHRHGAPPGRIAQAAHRAQRTAVTVRCGDAGGRDRERSRVRSRQGHHPRGPQAVEHPLRRERPREDRGLRHRAHAAGRRRHAAAVRDGDVRGAGARRGQARDRGHGCLRARSDPLRDARRQAAVRQRQRRRPDARSRRARSGAAEPPPTESGARARHDRPEDAREGAAPPIPEGVRSRAGTRVDREPRQGARDDAVRARDDRAHPRLRSGGGPEPGRGAPLELRPAGTAICSSARSSRCRSSLSRRSRASA